KTLKPSHICMIVPSRWMKGGKGLDRFRKDMIDDTRLVSMHDFEDAKDIFPSINLDGGVCYFLWSASHNDQLDYVYSPKGAEENCSRRFLRNSYTDNVIRDFRQLSIIEKVGRKGEPKFSDLVSRRKPYGIATDLFNNPSKYGYTSI